MKQKLSEFPVISNPDCNGDCNSRIREKNLEDGICKRVNSQFDGGSLRCVNTWANEKIHFLTRYFDIFAVSMKDKWAGNINYIEICSGPGICIDNKTTKEILGTALAITNKPGFQYLYKAVFVDINPSVIDTLNARFENNNLSPKAVAITGDYNDPAGLLASIKPLISKTGLNLIFIDPTDCSVPFNTVKRLLLGLGKADLIINVMYGSDAKRGIGYAFENPLYPSHKKYSRFLGDSAFFENDDNIKLAKNGQNDELHRKFIAFYVSQLEEIGYIYVDYESIKHYYELLFASRNPLGKKFWKEAAKKKLHGDRTLF